MCKTMPLIRTHMYESRDVPLEGRLMYMYERQCGLGLTCIALGKSPLGGPMMCMHYRIFTGDGDFELAYVTSTCFAPQLHGFINGF